VTELIEGSSSPGTEECILCHEGHKDKKEDKLPDHTFERNDDALTQNGRVFIKSSGRSEYYPRDDDNAFVSPLNDAKWPADEIFNSYTTKKGTKINYAEKYQRPPIKGYIAAPHHMVAICCMNGTNGLAGVPKVNAWVHRGGYDINNGGNCIFLPSSASQFYVAYYYWKVRGTGQALQGHLGAHRKMYFETVWDHLERIPRLFASVGICYSTEDDEQKDSTAAAIVDEVHGLEALLFHKLTSLKPEERYRLGAESWIEIPDESAEFHVPAGVPENLQSYEILPVWY